MEFKLPTREVTVDGQVRYYLPAGTYAFLAVALFAAFLSGLVIGARVEASTAVIVAAIALALTIGFSIGKSDGDSEPYIGYETDEDWAAISDSRAR